MPDQYAPDTTETRLDRLRPDDLISGFRTTPIVQALFIALGIHVLVIAVTSVGYVYNTLINPDQVAEATEDAGDAEQPKARAAAGDAAAQPAEGDPAGDAAEDPDTNGADLSGDGRVSDVERDVTATEEGPDSPFGDDPLFAD